MHEKNKLGEALQEEAKVLDSLSNLDSQILELESSLKAEKSRHHETSNLFLEADRRVEEFWKTI